MIKEFDFYYMCLSRFLFCIQEICMDYYFETNFKLVLKSFKVRKNRNIISWSRVSIDSNGQEIVGIFYEKNLLTFC